MLGYELGRKKLRRTLYGRGYVGKVPIVVSAILVSCPFPLFVYTIHDIIASQPTIVLMDYEVNIGPS